MPADAKKLYYRLQNRTPFHPLRVGNAGDDSVAGSGRLGFAPTASTLLLFHHYIFASTGKPNDGLVTVDSASWGRFDPATWPADDAEEVGYNLDNLILPPAFPYLVNFDRIIANVAML